MIYLLFGLCFLVWLGMHFHVFRVIRDTRFLASLSKSAIGSAILLLFLFPFVRNYFSSELPISLMLWIHFISVIWIVFVIQCCLWSLVSYCVISLVSFAYKKFGVNSGFDFSSRQKAIISITLSLILIIYGYLDAKNLRVREYTISDRRIPASVERFRIVHVTDIHCGGLVSNIDLLREIVDRIKTLSPDLVISSGDLVDKPMLNRPEMENIYRSLQPPYGKIGVTGNHEFLSGIDEAVAFHKSAGFRLLRNEGILVTPFLAVFGVDDPFGKGKNLKRFNESELLQAPLREASSTGDVPALDGPMPALGKNPTNESVKQPTPDVIASAPSPSLDVAPRRGNNAFFGNAFRIFVKHPPSVTPEAQEAFDLQLSGHTHGGQFFPLHILMKLVHNVPMGFSKHGSRLSLYLSSGAGTYGPPVRIFAPPEITVIDLVPLK